MFVENNEYEILTPTGWRDFKGITCVDGKKTHRVKLENNSYVDATLGHFFFVNDEKVKLENLSAGDSIDTIDGPSKIIEITENTLTTVYDIVEVEDEKHQFIVNNNIITKNCDEFSYVRPTIAKEFWTSISPTLSTGGKAIITSTPNSDEDQFATIWKEANKCIDEFGNPTDLGRNGFKAYRSYWNEHPDRDEKWKQEEMGRIGEERFRREYSCEFLIFDETLINSIVLAELGGIEPKFRQGQIRWFKRPEKGKIYLIALDPSLGTGGDPAAIQVLELPNCLQVGEWQHNRTIIQHQVQIIKEICQFIYDEIGSESDIYYSVENNTLGEAALISIAEIGEENIRGIFLSEPVKAGQTRRYRKGFHTSNKTKLAACAKFKSMVEQKKMVISSNNLISELKNFVASVGSFAAKSGETDDLVTSMLLAVRMVQTLQNFDADLDTRLRNNDDEFLEPLPFIMM